MAERLQYSPLIEALCEFRFVPSPTWDWTIPGRLYDEIRDDYPLRAQVDGLSVELSMGEKASAQTVIKGPERVQMKRQDGTAMVQVGPHMLVVNHLEPYVDWETFRPMIIAAFEKHERIAGVAKVARIGLRYINRIRLPDRDCRVEEILTLVHKITGPLDRPLINLYHRYELEHDTPKAILIVQIGTQRTDQGNFVMLDLDIGSAPKQEFERIDNVLAWLDDAHDRIDDAFFAAVTPAMIGKWKRGKN